MHFAIRSASAGLLCCAAILPGCTATGEPPPEVAPILAPISAPAGYDAALAERLGADDLGMRAYVLAILMTGPQDAALTDKDARAEIFRGHFANMERLAAEGKLVLAGPMGGEDGRRGLFILNTPDIETAQQWVATDPSVEAGVFTVAYSKYYGSAALMLINDVHPTIQKKGIGE
ncbi:YciI family protein [Hyphomonas sp. WL0036]|uniref:YciI family protein n=1 Tax=Hyphomonas sediminis TaxID=2866160 RepID=UPI001C81DE11|nr:YciI family protein [Hyphomonas sediminis]MBY9068440.1 YciI family protein [Hyphomonas sediminis]